MVKDELLAASPDLAKDIFDTFAQAKREYVERLRQGGIQEPSANDKLFQKVMEITGDPLPYGVESNRKVLEALIQRSVEQGIITRPFTVDELFAAGTHTLTA